MNLGALIAVTAFRVRFSGTRTRAGLGTTPQKQRGVALLAFCEVTLPRTPALPPLPEFASGAFPSALITTTRNGGQRGARRRRFPKFSGPPASPSSPLQTRLGAAPGTCSSRDLGHKHQRRGAKICSEPGKLCGAAALRAAGKGLPVSCPGWGQRLSPVVSQLSLAARHEFPTPRTAMSPLSRLSARGEHGRFCNDFDEKACFNSPPSPRRNVKFPPVFRISSRALQRRDFCRLISPQK